MCFWRLSGLIAKAAFPFPQTELAEYETNLLNRSDLIWLKLGKDAEYSVPAVFLRPQTGNSVSDKYTVLLSHGNGQDLADSIPLAQYIVNQTGSNVFVYDYPGYSLNRFREEGAKASETSVKGCKLAIEAAYRYLVGDEGISPSSIILYGISIGSGPSLHLATKTKLYSNQCAGLLLQSPLLSGYKVVFDSMPRALTCAMCCCGCYDIFQNYKKIKKLKMPLALIHGVKDEVVPVEHGRKLVSLLPSSTALIDPVYPDGGHNDLDPKQSIQLLQKLISNAKSLPKINPPSTLEPVITPSPQITGLNHPNSTEPTNFPIPDHQTPTQTPLTREELRKRKQEATERRKLASKTT